MCFWEYIWEFILCSWYLLLFYKKVSLHFLCVWFVEYIAFVEAHRVTSTTSASSYDDDDNDVHVNLIWWSVGRWMNDAMLFVVFVIIIAIICCISLPPYDMIQKSSMVGSGVRMSMQWCIRASVCVHVLYISFELFNKWHHKIKRFIRISCENLFTIPQTFYVRFGVNECEFETSRTVGAVLEFCYEHKCREFQFVKY